MNAMKQESYTTGARVAGLSLAPGSGRRLWLERFHRYGGAWLGLLALAVLYRAGSFGFLALDRELFATQSPVVFGVFRDGLQAAFQFPATWDGCFGPLGMVAHMVDFQLFRSEPAMHHLTSLWLHVFNIVLLFAVAKELGKSVWVAALAAAIFALHPLQVAPVVWISQRRILLATFFVLSAV
jgi:hypothetical protein